MTVLPMFPLGTVLLPSAVLPLHVFEDRYRTLVRHCLDGDGRFGVVLIERGSEVGGGDSRTLVGTIAHIVEVARFDDGRYALAAVGRERIRVNEWLDDDPYPRADVDQWVDPDPEPEVEHQLAAAVVSLRRLLAHRTEAGDDVAPATIELADDVVTATYQAAVLAPFGPVDKQALLAAPTPGARVALLDRLLTEELDALDRLRELGPPPGHPQDGLEDEP
jgi:Lon protease-like protein